MIRVDAKRGPVWVPALMLLLCALPVRAGGDLSRFAVAPVPNGGFTSMAPSPLFPTEWTMGATLRYAHHPLVWRYRDGSFEPVLRSQTGADLAFAVGVMRLIDLGLVMPVVLRQEGSNAEELGNLSGSGRGDLRVVPRFYLVPERSYGVGVALIPEFTLPTGDAGRLMGDGHAAFRPKVAVALPIEAARLLANVGYRWRRNDRIADETLRDEIELRLGAEVGLQKLGLVMPITAMAEWSTSLAATAPFRGDGLLASELLAGARMRAAADWLVTPGVGVGLTQGLGTPSWRAWVGLAYAPELPDTDGDGLPDLADDCPTEPEDYDQFADIDGCPDLDNDGDEIPDLEDKCPFEPEERGDAAVGDGCPGAPTVDSDGDGILDTDDECPNVVEDQDGFEDEDGCPDSDHDHDGVANERDRCPKEKETINGVDDDDGCPDQGVAKTEYVPETRIDIRETVLFETGKSTIKAESMPLLAQVALQILAHPEIRKIRIEGHTDDRGPEEDNLYLSQDRADAVRRFLVTQGVQKELLDAQGFGETMPIDTNNTAAGRARNRRVEFVIVETRRPAPTPPATSNDTP